MSLSNNDYQDIMRQYEARRLSNYRLHEQRKKDIYTTIPEIKDLDRQITSNSISLGKQLIVSDDPALRENYRKKNHVLIEKKQALLHEAGYSSDYLEPIYHCKKCKDTGYIGQEPCSCFHQAMIDHLYSGSNMAKILARENFRTFREDYYSDQMTKQGLPSPRRNIQKVVEHCKTFISRFPNHDNILFQGSTGVGKTFLSHCIAKEIMNRGFTCVYMTAFQLFDTLAKHTFGREKNAQQETSANLIFQCDLLIIDDLGTELSNSFTVSQLFLCLNERILRKKSTIISTNLSLNQLAEIYSERTFSRISSNYTMIKLFGDDIRIKKKLQ